MITLTLKFSVHETLIEGIYAPTDSSERIDKDEFYEEL